MNDLYIAMYHYTRDLSNSRYPKIRGLDYKLFKKQLIFFEKNFHVVTMEQVIEAWQHKNNSLPENALLLTFDDGYIDNYLFAYPLLKEHRMQGSFFVTGKTLAEHVVLNVNKVHFILASADIGMIKKRLLERMEACRDQFKFPDSQQLWEKYAEPNRFDSADVIFVKRMLQTALPEELRSRIASELFDEFVGLEEEKFSRELYMNRDQIRQMKRDGMFFGIHGYEHYWLANLETEQMEKDISKALDTMEEFIDRDAWVMNYPYGSYNSKVIDFVKRKGSVLGFTTRVGAADLRYDNPFEIPRLDCNDFPPKSDNYKKMQQNMAY